MRRTKIVCTLGPSSSSPEVVRTLMSEGMDIVRLNLSHGDASSHRSLFHLVRQTAHDLNRNVAILMDLQGPKIRTGKLQDGKPVTLEEGALFTITSEEKAGSASCVSTTYKNLPHDVRPGDRILLADGMIELRVESVNIPEVLCRVVHGGLLGEHKGINLPGVPVSAPSLTEKDVTDLQLALELGADYVGLSFVRRAEDLREIRAKIAAAGKKTGVVAKIERPEALEQLDDIIGLSDAVMVARGDLGVELPLCDVPQIQKRIIRDCNRHGVPVITATQMLESMIREPRPTRAEATDVANAIYDGTDAVMLSGETATGAYPVDAVRMMRCIVERADEARAEHAIEQPWLNDNEDPSRTFSCAIGHAAKLLSESLSVRRIVCFTSSGYTARMVAQYRPRVPITAFTLTEEAKRRCAMYWGVEGVLCAEVDSLDKMTVVIEHYLLKHNLAEKGDTVVLVAGTPLAVAGRTNLLKLHRVGELS